MMKHIISPCDAYDMWYDDDFDWIFDEEHSLWRLDQGYIAIKIYGRLYRLHRLLWRLAYGDAPHMLDHIDGNVADNRLDNLRPTSARLNALNSYKHRAGKLPGTTFDRGKYKAYRWTPDKYYHLGYYDTEEEAHARWLEEITRLGQYSQYFPERA